MYETSSVRVLPEKVCICLFRIKWKDHFYSSLFHRFYSFCKLWPPIYALLKLHYALLLPPSSLSLVCVVSLCISMCSVLLFFNLISLAYLRIVICLHVCMYLLSLFIVLCNCVCVIRICICGYICDQHKSFLVNLILCMFEFRYFVVSVQYICQLKSIYVQSIFNP